MSRNPDDAPDVRSDWLVEAIQIQLREQVWQGEPDHEWASSGDVTQVMDLDQAQGSEEPEGFNGMYRLDGRGSFRRVHARDERAHQR